MLDTVRMTRAERVSPRRPAALVVALPVLVIATLGLWDLGRPSMYGTEAVTWWAAHLSLPQLGHVLLHVDAVHGTYYLLMHAVLAAGGGTFMLRLPSVIGACVAVAATALLVRRLTGRDRPALFAGLALAVLPLTSATAQQGRSYAIDIAAAVLAWHLFVRALDDGAAAGAWRRWPWYALALAGCAYLHEMTLLMIAAHGATLLWAGAGRDTVRAWLRACGLAVVLALPVLVLSLTQSGQVQWIRPSTPGTLVAAYRALLGPGSAVLLLNLMLIMISATALLARHRPSAATDGAADIGGGSVGRLSVPVLALPLLVLPPLLLVGESMVAHPLYGGTRYVVWCLPAAAMLIGDGLDRLLSSDSGRNPLLWLVLRRESGPQRGVSRVMATLAAVLGVGVLAGALVAQRAVIERAHTAAGAPQDLLAVASYIRDHARTGDGVVFAPRSFESVVLGYPRDFAGVRDLVLAVPGDRSGTLYGTDRPGPAIRRAVDATARVWLIGTRTPAARHDRPELEALARHFRVAQRTHVHGATITLFERISRASG
ncbi:MAG: glycosyltransferase family 39 protein [Jatrophihabitans sp.]|uniref:glycosyltransferase family 39 protein n=1 Tax=Jatrophihabitans sp. TaxID=1932789 RepID=UPI003F7F6081